MYAHKEADQDTGVSLYSLQTRSLLKEGSSPFGLTWLSATLESHLSQLPGAGYRYPQSCLVLVLALMWVLVVASPNGCRASTLTYRTTFSAFSIMRESEMRLVFSKPLP